MKHAYITLIEQSAISPLTAKQIAIIIGGKSRGSDCVTHLRAMKSIHVEVVGQVPHVPGQPGRSEQLYVIRHSSDPRAIIARVTADIAKRDRSAALKGARS